MKKVNITGLRFVHFRVVFFPSCQTPVSDAVWVSSAINASTELFHPQESIWQLEHIYF